MVVAQCTLRMASTADAEDVAQIHVDSWQDTYHGLLPTSYLDQMSVRKLTGWWRHRLRHEQTATWLAIVDEVITGFVTIADGDEDGFAGEITMLYVTPSWLRRGIGQTLMVAALEALEDAGYRWLTVSVVEGNRNARAFYESFGLELDGKGHHDVFHGVEVAVVRYAMALNTFELDSLMDEL